MKLPKLAEIIEVGPRDGLQSQTDPLTKDQKIQWIKSLQDAGIRRIEVGAFVSPKWVPAMADSLEVIQELPRTPETHYLALVPNAKGMEKALEAQVDEIAIFTAASEVFCQKNINCSIEESLQKFRPVLELAQTQSLPTRGYVSTVFSCPYSGPVTLSQIWPVMDALFEMGCHEVSLGDTTGVANPLQVRQFFTEALRRYPCESLVAHFHDTWGRGLANCWEALQLGIVKFDSSGGGLGGCPYAPGASGNIATDDLDALFKQVNVQTGIDSDKLHRSSQLLQSFLPSALPSKTFVASH